VFKFIYTITEGMTLVNTHLHAQRVLKMFSEEVKAAEVCNWSFNSI